MPRCLLFLLPGLGDALVASPIVESAARAGWQLDAAVMLEPVADYARALPAVHDVEFFDLMAGQGRAIPSALRLRRRRYDAAFLPFPAARWQYHAMALAANARRLWTHDYGGAANAFARAARARCVSLEGGHRIWENVRLARAAGLDPATPAYELPPSWRRPTVRGLLGVHPGSMRYKGNDRKRWPVENFIALMAASAAAGRRIRLFLGPAERELAPAFSSVAGIADVDSVDAALPEAAARLSECEVFVGNDAGFAHLASGLGVKTVVLYGMTNPHRSQPVGPSIVVRPSSCPPCHDEGMPDFSCMLNIGYRCIQSDLSLERARAAVEIAFAGPLPHFHPNERGNYRLFGRGHHSTAAMSMPEATSQARAEMSDTTAGI